jgi:hypothetical protein
MLVAGDITASRNPDCDPSAAFATAQFMTA